MKIKSFIVCLGLLVGACSMHPLYAQREDLLKQVATIHVEPVHGEGSYQMGLTLATKLNPTHLQEETKYRLKIQIDKPITSNESIRTDNFATLEKMSVTVKYKLFDIEQKKDVISSSVRTNGMYSIIQEPYATQVAKEKLYQDLLNSLSDDIITHIYSYFDEINSES